MAKCTGRRCPMQVGYRPNECDYKDCPSYSYKTIRDCHKCVYEIECHGNPLDCKDYKRDASDGGYY